jgi:hypothetical protein
VSRDGNETPQLTFYPARESTWEIAKPETGCEYGGDNSEKPVSKWEINPLNCRNDAPTIVSLNFREGSRLIF